MADVELIIKISEECYENLLKNCRFSSEEIPVVSLAIATGTPLPKGHGNLIDSKPIYDSLIQTYRADKKDYPKRGKEYRVGLSNAIDLLNAAPTIIEADKEK